MQSNPKNELKLVKEKIEKLKGKRDLLLDKEIKLPSEIAFLEEFDKELEKLKDDEKFWHGIIISYEVVRANGNSWHKLYTFHQLLHETIPDLNNFKTKTTSKTETVPTNPRECGRSFTEWISFDQEVREFYQNNKQVKELFSAVLDNVEFSFNKRSCSNELDVQYRVLNNFALPLEALLEAMGINSFFKRAGGDSQVLFDPDIAWKIGGELNSSLGIIVEVKTWWTDQFPADIISQYLEDVEKGGPDTNLVNALQQMYGYMSFNNMRYGILTTYKQTLFLRRQGSSSLAISEPISLNTALKYWLFVLYKAREEGFYSSPTANPFGHAELEPIVPSKSPIYSDKKDWKYNLTHITSSQIRLAEINEGDVSRGCYGVVISGDISGKPSLKFKMVDSFNNSNAMEICEKEVAIYKKLESLQGEFIPQFYGFYNLHGFLIMALEDCGAPLPRSDYERFKAQIDLIIRKMESLNVQHNDLEFRQLNGRDVHPNILVKEGKIKIIDFHISIVKDEEAITKRQKLLK
jgi:hypothetical protein